MAAPPIRVVTVLGQFQRPLLQAKECQRRAKVGTALLVVGHLVQRLQVGQTLDRLAGRLHRLASPELVRIHLRQQQERNRVLVIQRNRLAQCTLGVVHAPQLVIGHAGVGLGAGIARLHDSSTQEGIQRGFGLALLEAQQPQAGPAHIVGRVLLQRGSKGLLGFCKAIGKGLQRTQLTPVAGALGLEFQGLQQVAARRADRLAFALRTAQAKPAPVIAGRDPGSAAKSQLGGGGTALAARQFALRQQHTGGVGIACTGQGLRAVIQPIRQQVDAGQLGQQIGFIRVSAQAVFQRVGGGRKLPVHQLQVRQHQIGRRRHALGRVGQGGQLTACQRAVPALDRLGAGENGDPRAAWRGGHLVRMQMARGIGCERIHPLDAVARVAQLDLDRRPAHFGHGGLIAAHRHRTLGVGKLHRAGQHGQQRLATGVHIQLPIRAADTGRGGRSLQVEAAVVLALGLGPGPPQRQQQRGGLRAAGQLLHLQHRVLVQPHLRVIGKQQRHLGGRQRAHKGPAWQQLGGLGRRPRCALYRALLTAALQADNLRGRPRRNRRVTQRRHQGERHAQRT